jgi:hypothetical protein
MASQQNLSAVIRQERGWGGHFIRADQCRFRRNTLLTLGDVRIVVSTVGRWITYNRKCVEIGPGRYYETMAFHASFDGRYWHQNVNRELPFTSPWSVSKLDADDIANDQHDAVVEEIARRIELGEFNDIEASNAKND